VVLLALIGWFAIQDALRLEQHHTSNTKESGPAIEVGVTGMTCDDCAAKLERTLNSDGGIDSARVTLKSGLAVVRGTATEARVRELVKQAGFHPL
ncbi:MAG: heavy-metal-associated domain-containing protein, partial [Aeoliella sp.]